MDTAAATWGLLAKGQAIPKAVNHHGAGSELRIGGADLTAAGSLLLDFAYLSARIRGICERRACAVAEVGEPAALELERRLADIDACDTAADFAALCAEELLVLSGHRWALRLTENVQMELVAGHVKVPRTRTGATDWSRVTKFRIEAIGGTCD